MQTKDFFYDLPEELIAQKPASKREHSRLLILKRNESKLEHRVFSDVTEYLYPGDVLVVNDVRVIPARLHAVRESGGHVEIMVLDGYRTGKTRAVLLKPAKRIRQGEHLFLPDGTALKVMERNGKQFNVIVTGTCDWETCLNKWGVMPLPPYIKRNRECDTMNVTDKDRYQTVYASNSGAVAAPTAGLHFSQTLLKQLKQIGVNIVSLTLWVGWGTFKPVESRLIQQHQMDSEIYSIPPETACAVRRAIKDNRRIIAVGTTSTRALESWAISQYYPEPVEKQEAGLYITPGYKFQILNALITNFHLPGSTLIMLVSAFAGRQQVLDAYHQAVKMKYRFYSYGDAMLIT